MPPRRPRGRPVGSQPLRPTEEQRRQVELLAGLGLRREEICLLIQNPHNGRPITMPSLLKHYRAELDRGTVRRNAKVVESLYNQAVGRPAEYDATGKRIRAEMPPNVAAAIFWCKARLRWSERVELTGAEGQPLAPVLQVVITGGDDRAAIRQGHAVIQQGPEIQLTAEQRKAEN